MNINDLTIGQAKELAAIFAQNEVRPSIDNEMIGKFVIVRCRDAGVHAGYLDACNGRECKLSKSRRLWYWKSANSASFLSGVATEGLHKDSKVGAPIDVYLSENCEIILCTPAAEKSITEIDSHEQ